MTYIQIVWGRMATGVKVVFMKDEGVTATEYGVIAALIAVVDIAANSLLGTNSTPPSRRTNRRHPTRIPEAGEAERILFVLLLQLREGSRVPVPLI